MSDRPYSHEQIDAVEAEIITLEAKLTALRDTRADMIFANMVNDADRYAKLSTCPFCHQEMDQDGDCINTRCMGNYWGLRFFVIGEEWQCNLKVADVDYNWAADDNVYPFDTQEQVPQSTTPECVYSSHKHDVLIRLAPKDSSIVVRNDRRQLFSRWRDDEEPRYWGLVHRLSFDHLLKCGMIALSDEGKTCGGYIITPDGRETLAKWDQTFSKYSFTRNHK